MFAIIMGDEAQKQKSNDYRNAFDRADRAKLNFLSTVKVRTLKFSSKSEHERFARIVTKIVELEQL